MKQSRGATFDAAAATFERHRALPGEAPKAIRASIWTAAGLTTPAQVLDIGAGTGRIGRAFVEAGDSYTGVDTSLAMLQEFSCQSPNCTLLQADGRSLPFADDSFDVVLLMQVLSGAEDWRGVLVEACRVLRPGGCIVVGHTVSPESGIDAQLKRRLRAILEEMQVPFVRPEEARNLALAWLMSHAVRHVHSIAASWTAEVTVEGFLKRHRTGARFAELPAAVREQALTALRAWAKGHFGSLDADFPEIHNFEVDIFEF